MISVDISVYSLFGAIVPLFTLSVISNQFLKKYWIQMASFSTFYIYFESVHSHMRTIMQGTVPSWSPEFMMVFMFTSLSILSTLIGTWLSKEYSNEIDRFSDKIKYHILISFYSFAPMPLMSFMPIQNAASFSKMIQSLTAIAVVMGLIGIVLLTVNLIRKINF